MIDIKKAREICEAATPGPWYSSPGINYSTGPYPIEKPTLEYWFDVVMGEHRIEGIENNSLEQFAHDANFIAFARTELPEALDEIESLRRKVDILYREVDTLFDRCNKTSKRIALAERICEAAESVASEDTVRHELLAYNMGLEMINSIEEWRKVVGK